MKNLLFLLLLFPLFLSAQEDVKHYNEGIKAHNAGDYNTAITCYKKALELNANNKDATNNIGIAYYNQSLGLFEKKNYDQSIEYVHHAMTYDPKNPNHYYMIGACQKAQKKFKEAIESYTKAIELDNKNAGFYAARAWTYNDLYDNKSTLVDIKKAAELDPNNAEYQYHCGKFKQEVSQEEFKTAGDNYTKAIKLKPDYKDAYADRAAYYMTFQQFEKALPDLKKAKELGAEVDHLIEAATFEIENK